MDFLKLKNNLPFKGVLFSSIAMAFAGLGDALLYSVLPIFGQQMGFSVFWIGVLLSINRFVRIPGNTFVALFISKKGYKKAMILASFTAMLTTVFYGVNLGVFLFVLARVLWGLSYSTMRISSLAYASEVVNNKNLMFGLIQSIKTVGAVIALYFGAYLVKIFNIKVAFIFLGVLSFIAILFTFSLPNIKKNTSKLDLKKMVHFSPLSLLAFLTSFVFDGILVVTISKLLVGYSQEDLLMVVSGYLLFRKLCSVIFSVISGWLSDLIGVQTVFNFSLVFVSLSLILIVYGQVEKGIVLAFLFNSILVALFPSVALKLNASNRLQTLTSITTWWDIGAATGTVLGLFLFQLLGLQILFWSLLLLLICSKLVYFKNNASFS